MGPAALMQLQRTAGNRAVAGLMRQGADPHPPRQRVVDRFEADENTRAIAEIEVVGHASPRWRTARTPEDADARNRGLAEQRSHQVAWEVELLLAELLPDRQLEFHHKVETRMDEPDTMTNPADVELESYGVGSSQTLGEAGARGRTANDDPMRRCEVRVTLRSATETQVDETTRHTHWLSGATRSWSLGLIAEGGIEFGAKGGAVLIQMRNNITEEVGTFAGGTFGGGLSVGIAPAKTQIPDFEYIYMPEEMTFEDFDGAWFSIMASGFGIGAFGYEVSTLYFRSFPNGHETPDDGVDVGGFTFGGFELNVGSYVSGTMNLIDSPKEGWDTTFNTIDRIPYLSEAQDKSAHTVLFETGEHSLTDDQRKALGKYLAGVAGGLI